MSMELRHYETTFILTPVLSEPQIQETIDKFNGFLKEKKATIIHKEKLGLRKLAYPIQHKSTGIYHVTEFMAIPAVIRALEAEYRREEKVMRFLTFALDKHGIAYNEKRRKGIIAPKTEHKKEAIG